MPTFAHLQKSVCSVGHFCMRNPHWKAPGPAPACLRFGEGKGLILEGGRQSKERALEILGGRVNLNPLGSTAA